MATLALEDVGTWSGGSGGTGRLARWGDAIVNYYRTSAFPQFGTTWADTGAAGAFSGFSIATTIAGEALYARAAQGDDTYLFMGREDESLVRVDTAGTATVIGTATTTSGTWGTIHAGHPSLVVTSHGTSRLSTYAKPGGGTGSDIVVTGVSSLFETVAVDPATGRVFASTIFAGTSRGVDCYEDDGTVVWEIEIPNAVNDSVRPVNGLALTSAGLIAYTTDVDTDTPGGDRVNNNWWLIDPATGAVSLLDVTVGGVEFGAWADAGNGMTSQIGSLSVLNNQVYIAGGSGIVWGGGIAGGWTVGRVAWGSRGAWH